jgi:hypothetical protein
VKRIIKAIADLKKEKDLDEMNPTIFYAVSYKLKLLLSLIFKSNGLVV